MNPVSEIGEHKFTPGEITRTLMEDYDTLVMRQDDRAALVSTSAA